MAWRVSAWQDRLTQVWWSSQRPGMLVGALSWSYATLIAGRRMAYRRGWLSPSHPGVPVIVVGNRIVGGAGKTPITLALLAVLQHHGWHPGVVSRGHGSSGTRPRAVTPASSPDEAGDEPVLIARRSAVPVWVGRDRAATARALRGAHPEVDVIVCDDGLQHLALARDIEIIVFDGRGIGNGHCLPAGPLREPLVVPSTASRQWVVYNAAAPSTTLPGVVALRSLAPPLALTEWRAGTSVQSTDDTAWDRWIGLGNRAWAVAGIGDPQRFFDDLRARALNPCTLALPDHARYDVWPWPASVHHVLVTEKDAVKLDADRLAHERPDCEVAVVPLRMALPRAFADELLATLQSLCPR